MSIEIKRPLQLCFACLQPHQLGGSMYQTCFACTTFMKQGVICIGVRNDAPLILRGGVEGNTAVLTEIDAYRDGNWCVATELRVPRRYRGVYRNGDPHRFAFLTTDEWKWLRLPQRGKSGASETRNGKYEALAED